MGVITCDVFSHSILSTWLVYTKPIIKCPIQEEWLRQCSWKLNLFPNLLFALECDANIKIFTGDMLTGYGAITTNKYKTHIWSFWTKQKKKLEWQCGMHKAYFMSPQWCLALNPKHVCPWWKQSLCGWSRPKLTEWMISLPKFLNIASSVITHHDWRPSLSLAMSFPTELAKSSEPSNSVQVPLPRSSHTYVTIKQTNTLFFHPDPVSSVC